MGEASLDTLVLAFDLGTHEAGWVLVASNMKILHLGYWKAHKWPLDFRLRELKSALSREMADIYIYIHQRILVAYEAPHARYAKPVLALAQAVGILKAELWGIRSGGAPEFIEMPMEISIAEAKLALTGRGNAGKLMMRDMARQLSGCMELNQHQADAYGVACAAWGKLDQKAMLEIAEEADAKM